MQKQDSPYPIFPFTVKKSWMNMHLLIPRVLINIRLAHRKHAINYIFQFFEVFAFNILPIIKQ